MLKFIKGDILEEKTKNEVIEFFKVKFRRNYI